MPLVESGELCSRGKRMAHKGLWAVAAAVGLLALGCPPNAALCTNGLQPCGQVNCVNADIDPNNCGGCGLACSAHELCQAAVCVCQPGATSCSGYCVLLDVDPKNCGTCGHACDAGDVCEEGSCHPAATLSSSEETGSAVPSPVC
jgi:hypothetical protein